jgi:uncharacterized protein (TIGR02594 family)
MEPIWLTIARNYLGVHELEGKGSNPVILGWAKRIGGWVKSFFVDDDIPWCALFINNCLLEAGLKGTGQSLAAGDFAKWGQLLHKPVLGCIVVLVRPGGHHVFFYLGERSDGLIYGIGGNQSNQVSYAWFDPQRVVVFRWPTALPIPATGPVLLAANGQPVSTHEG